MIQFGVGALAGVILAFLAFYAAPNSLTNKAHDAIQECERDLPRSQRCHLTAVPNEVTK